LVELVATLATLGALLAVAGGLFRLASRTARLTAERAEALDATRTAAALLSFEARPLGQGDFTVFSDSIQLRAFRGYVIPCATGGGTVLARHTGVRPPDETKDSVLALADSAEFVAALTAVSPAPPGGPCAAFPGEQILSLTTSVLLPSAAAWLVFERGTYSFGTNALRYRRGFGGRQPITAPAFADAASGFMFMDPPASLALLLAPAQANSFALPAALRVPLPNADTGSAP
jgi:hypothetical protein